MMDGLFAEPTRQFLREMDAACEQAGWGVPPAIFSVVLDSVAGRPVLLSQLLPSAVVYAYRSVQLGVSPQATALQMCEMLTLAVKDAGPAPSHVFGWGLLIEAVGQVQETTAMQEARVIIVASLLLDDPCHLALARCRGMEQPCEWAEVEGELVEALTRLCRAGSGRA